MERDFAARMPLWERVRRRQHDHNPQSVRLTRLQVDAPTVPLDDVLCDRKAQAEAGLAAGGVYLEEGLEHLVAKDLGNARSIIGDLDFDATARRGTEHHRHRASVFD